MRLWHEYLIPYLDNKRLIGQHRECCALRGKGWGKKHSVVNYVFEHHVALLIQYHALVMNECSMRGFKTDTKWLDVNYRGKNCLPFPKHEISSMIYFEHFKCGLESELDYYSTKFIYPEHNPKYLLECLDNLQSKNVELINNISVAELKLKLEIAGV
jgi:uncharacterized protein (TIGR02328 family)